MPNLKSCTGTDIMLTDLQNYLSENDCCALIISPENIRYFTGFETSNGYLAVSGDSSVFITDGRYIEAAEKAVKNCEVRLQLRIYPQLAEILSGMGCRRLLVEATGMNLSVYNSLKGVLKNINILTDTTLDSVINTLRSVKTPQEVEMIERAQLIAESAFEHILGFIKPGVTQKEVAMELDRHMLINGADAVSFETIAISGTKTSMPHGVPGAEKIENGNFVTMDFGAVFGGYHSDMTRTVAVGSVSEEMKKVYFTVLEAQKACLEILAESVPCAKADSAARSVIEKAGYGEYFTHSTGHGVGVEIHEYPNLAPSSKSVLKAGNIVTVEPGIYLPGKFGVRIEDMAYITKSGCVNLTQAPKELIIL